MRIRAIDRRLAALCGILVLASADRPASAQVAPRDFFTEPVLIVAGGGHHAPVRSMAFATPDGSQLLTGGMDKVVHVWNLDADRSRPGRTLRPPNWRGFRGQVNALALSPRVDAGNQRLLAVAGHGVLGDLGEILLFRYPGPTGQGTGDVEGQLCATTPGTGHTSVVTSIAFTPDGRFLASASNDKTVRIWDVDARRSVAVIADATQAVNSLVIFANGTRLAFGGRDGYLRLYDITDRARPRPFRPAPPVLQNAADPLSGTIVALAVSPNNGWIVAGTEGGMLTRYDASTLAAVRLQNQPIPGAESGPVEAVAACPDNTRIAVSVIGRNLASRGERPFVTCFVEIRALLDGRLLERVAQTPDLVQALAFSPDGRRLAFSGGESQAIYFKDLAANAPALVEIPGQGSSLWDVGFREDGRAVRFARLRPDEPGKAAEYQAFDLRGRFLYDPEPDEGPYRHAVASAAGWTIQPVDVNRLNFLNGAGGGWQGTLDVDDERRWFSYTVIPPDPAAGHKDPIAAVGCGTGIVLWNLATGQRTRFFNGHAGPVYALAASRDGKWLISGSADQTLRIWPLAGADRPAPFGARFEKRADGAWVVADVTPGGFAEGIKLRKGLAIEEFYIGVGPVVTRQAPAQLDAILPRLDDQPATWMYSFFGRVGAEPDRFGGAATKRDSPALTIYPSLDRDWVIWTPRGHYDTSIAGDRKFLGWLTNRAVANSPARLLAGRFDTIDKFEKRFRQPKAPAANALDRLLDTGDPIQAAAAAPAVAAEVADPRNSGADVAIAPVLAAGAAGAGLVAPPVPGRPLVARQPLVSVRYAFAAAANAASIVRARITVGGREVVNLLAGPPLAASQGTAQVALDPGQAPVILETEDAKGVIRTSQFVVDNQAPPNPARRPSRLEIVAIGSESFGHKGLSAIRYAGGDIRALADFLRDRLVDPATGKRFEPGQVVIKTFEGREKLATGPLTAALDELKKAAADRRLAANDAVVVVIESHFFAARSQERIAMAEPGDGPIPPSIPAADLSDRLGELSALGCRVLVLVDAVHEVAEPGWDNDIKEWIRQLQSRSHVAAFIASDHGPSRPLPGQSRTTGHRAFADGVLGVLEARSAGRAREPNGPMSLFDFQRTLIDSVLENTRRKQHVQVFLPETLPIDVPFLDTTGPPPQVGQLDPSAAPPPAPAGRR